MSLKSMCLTCQVCWRQTVEAATFCLKSVPGTLCCPGRFTQQKLMFLFTFCGSMSRPFWTDKIRNIIFYLFIYYYEIIIPPDAMWEYLTNRQNQVELKLDLVFLLKKGCSIYHQRHRQEHPFFNRKTTSNFNSTWFYLLVRYSHIVSGGIIISQ